MKELENLTEEEKQKVLDEVNSLPEDSTGNTSIVTVAEDERLSEIIGKMTPKEMLEQNIAANFRSRQVLAQLLPQLSKKNLIRVFLATLALPETGTDLEFGGTQEDKNRAVSSFIQSQVASNSRMYVVSTEAVAKARLEQKRQEEELNNKETNS